MAYRFLVIVLGLIGVVTSCYIFHWWRHPGILGTKSPGRWLGHIASAALMLVLAPILAVLELGHFTHFLAPVIKLNKLLGLDFRFEPGERVQVRVDVPGSPPLQTIGTVISARLVRGAAPAAPSGTEGSILYLVQLDDGTRVEIAEQFLKETL